MYIELSALQGPSVERPHVASMDAVSPCSVSLCLALSLRSPLPSSSVSFSLSLSLSLSRVLMLEAWNRGLVMAVSANSPQETSHRKEILEIALLLAAY